MGLFDGKVALVTGGASGIGLATVRRLAGEGARLVAADLNAEAGEAAAAEVGGRFVRLDVGDPAEWQAVVDGIEAAEGGLDIAYLNAGVTTGEADIRKLTDEQYRRIMGANVDGVVFGTRAVATAMERRGGGSIVATASLAGIVAFPLDPIYTLTKHAVVGFIRSVAPGLAAYRITANCVCPGIVDTPLLGDGRQVLTQAGFPLLAPDDIADAVVTAITSGHSGEAWACQPGRDPERFVFPQVPGPRTEGAEGMRPPTLDRM